jgi:hypothetical protein
MSNNGGPIWYPGGPAHWNPPGAGLGWMLPDKYGALAYSDSTGRYLCSYGCETQALAEQEAVTRLGEHDARSVLWARNGFIAVAIAGERITWAYGTARSARKGALAKCGHGAKVVYVVDTSTGELNPPNYGKIIRRVVLAWLALVIVMLTVITVIHSMH